MALRRNQIVARSNELSDSCTGTNITVAARKTGASRDARQQVGNWYRRQVAGRLVPRLLRDTKRFTGGFRAGPLILALGSATYFSRNDSL